MIDQCVRPVKTVHRLPAPPVRAPRRPPWKWLGVFAVVLGCLAVAGFSFLPGRGGAEELRLPGAVEGLEVQLGSRVGGRVAAVHVEEGQLVEPGQVLVAFEAQELTARRDQAQSRLVAAQAAVERGVHGPLPEEIAEAQAAADAARADSSESGPALGKSRNARPRANWTPHWWSKDRPTRTSLGPSAW